ncbi:SDR family oxidoreductase [Frankia sp. AgB32]|uniref:SDR family oxidoreductase n=1 Tax=Frankia sp. AgB32 TaxID=631119 RepID=UPI002010493B|nr:SDR family oxidoreductase [Frankia sp. AgB32]MCK9894220.1 SDR family oxidoreductase [Frankia sp. AgB32]
MVEQTRGSVLVTGAGGGIGVVTARALVARGYHVYAGVRRPGGPDGPAGRLGAAGIEEIELDVTDPGSVREAADEIAARQRGAGLTALVNNAGVLVQGPLELVPASEMHRQFAVNVLGAAEMVRAFLPLLRHGDGRIVNISAPTGRLAVPFAGPISASKAALESLSDALRVELEPWRIPVIVVVPGAVDTQIFVKSAAASQAAMDAADPRQVALYSQQLAAVAKALDGNKPSPPEKVAATIVRAIEARRPKTRYLATTDARVFGIVARLPAGLRVRLLRSQLGLRDIQPVPAPAP